MTALAQELRKKLEGAIGQARVEAEAGARKALDALGVAEEKPVEGLSSEAKALRRRLRAHVEAAKGPLPAARVERLVQQIAYEQWHRMLFARFLAENDLLLEPGMGVPVSLSDVEELAREKGADPWTLAASYAESMLPRIFRQGDPVLDVALPRESQVALQKLLNDIAVETFTADDSLGWTYQFWQAEKKKAVNDSGKKIGAEELPAVTQLFTEHYMVRFLFDQTLGAWHAAKVLAQQPDLAATAKDEQELRRAVRLTAAGGDGFESLRFVRDPEDGPWRPAAGGYDGWPRTARELRVLDPCCGSGHFLVVGLKVLTRLRMEEEGLSVADALRAVIADNLFGLELDPRCTQIAAFNVALAAWKLVGKPIELPPLNIASSGLGVSASKDEWMAMAGEDAALRNRLGLLHETFQNAPLLGSLIDPAAGRGEMFRDDVASASRELAALLQREERDDERRERAVTAQGLARAAEILAGQYDLVITNVPYLGRGDQAPLLKEFAETTYPEAKADLATVFLARSLRWTGSHGSVAVVTPQNWLFLTSYKKLREQLLSQRTWNVVARLGSGAFETISGEVVNVALVVLSSPRPPEDWRLAGLDVSAPRGQRAILAREKAEMLRGGGVFSVAQAPMLSNPDGRIDFAAIADRPLLSAIATNHQGLSTGDNPRFRRVHWEVERLGSVWAREQSSTERVAPYSGRAGILRWEQGNGELFEFGRANVEALHNVDRRGEQAWAHDGVAIRQMGSLAATLYTGEQFDTSVAVILPERVADLPALWCYCSSPDFISELRACNPKLSIDNGYVTKIPFDHPHWQRVAAEKYPNGLPEPESDDPTQWLFHGHPAKGQPGTELQVAVARLLGYRWPPELDADMRLSTEARAWVARSKELDPFADGDGIVPLIPLRGERAASDRLQSLLAAAFGSDWSAARERALIASTNSKAADLAEWLRDDFFEQHSKLFHHRPFVWHVWDGTRDGFAALVNAHRLTGPDGMGKRTLEALTYTYLGDWIATQRAAVNRGEEGSDARLEAALDLQKQLERILGGVVPCDLFIRWKPVHEQPIGWEPDVNDGIRLNIRPFLSADLRKGGRKGAGILRWKPGISWNKDRGTEPQSLRPKDDFPWFWSCPGTGSLDERTDFPGGPSFDGSRWNDLHLTPSFKLSSRTRRGPGGGA